jgi:FkbM family methyltransferase
MSIISRLAKNFVKNIGYGIKHNPLPRWYHKDPFLAQQYLLRDEPVARVLDVGANVGQSAQEYAKLFPESRIYCFEPVPEAFRRLEKNCESLVRVTCIRQAVSDTVGTSKMTLTNMLTMNSLLPMQDESRNLGAIDVETTTLDLFCHQNNIERVNILKMDIQGGEQLAISGAAGLLACHRVDLLYTEVLFSRLYQGQAESYKLHESLARFGYSLFGFYNLRLGIINQLQHGNAIFISPRIEQQLLERQGSAKQAA